VLFDIFWGCSHTCEKQVAMDVLDVVWFERLVFSAFCVPKIMKCLLKEWHLTCRMATVYRFLVFSGDDHQIW